MNKKSLYRIYLLITVGIGLSGISQAQAAGDNGLILAPFPQARIVYHSANNVDDYRFTLGALKKVNNVWRAEQEQRLAGELTRQTLEIPAGFAAEEIYQHFIEQIEKLPSRKLFTCSSRRCGSSNSWANNRFGIKQLYGLDRHQFYGAYELEGADNTLSFVAVYAVMRGNKRVYAQLDILKSTDTRTSGIAANPATIVEQLKNKGYYVLPGFTVDGQQAPSQDEKHLQVLFQALQQERFLNVSVVGHDYQSTSLQQQQSDSLNYAEFIKKQLLSKGIASERIGTFGVGSLAPERRGSERQRVEIIRVITP